MMDYLFSSLLPGKGVNLAGTGLSSIMANTALVVGVNILRPVIEQHFYPAIGRHTATSLDNRQYFKAVLSPRHDLLSPALDGLNTIHLKVKPTKAIIATAVTVVKVVPTPVQIFQKESLFSPIFGIIACMILALVGTILAFQHYRQGASWSSSSAAGSASDSSLEPYSRDLTPPNDDSSDELSGSGGYSPPVPIFDLFNDFPILRLDKAVDTGDQKVRDEDGAPPPPPPSFPTPVEDGDAFNSKPFISKWLSLTLVLSIILFVTKRFFKGYGKNQNEASAPTVSERITVNEISGGVVSLFPSATPVINIHPTCPNLLPLVEVEPKPQSLSISTLVMSAVSQRSKKLMVIVFSFLFMSFLFGLPFIAQYFLDYYLQRTTNTFLPMATRRGSLEETIASVPVTTSVSSLPLIPTSAQVMDGAAGNDGVNVATGGDEETDDLPLALVPAFEPATDDAVGSDEVTGDDEETDVLSPLVPTIAPATDDAARGDEVNAATGDDEETDVLSLVPTFAPATDDTARRDEVNAATGSDEETDDLMKNTVRHELSFNNVGDNTLVLYGKASPLAVDLEDIFDASDDGVPFLEVFRALSISGSSDDIPASKEKSETSPTPMFGLPATGKMSTINGKDIKVLSEHIPPKSNIPVLAKKVQSAPVRAYTLPICGAALVRSNTTNKKTVSMESLNPEASSFAPRSYVPVRRQSSSTSLHYCYSPPSPTRPGLSASIHAPSPRRKGLSASIHAFSSLSEEDLCGSIHAPSAPPRPVSSASIYVPRSPPGIDSSASIHAPCTPPKRGLNASIHAPSQHEPMEPIPIPVVDLSPDRRVRRVIDPQRECDLVVLAGGNPVSYASP